uniref:Transcription initiation factor TFIID subunit 2 isoform X1 n=1 Tax=Rhizophora mucronata TaxID=61149 RepID=A0A2P2MHP1_RHIMU
MARRMRSCMGAAENLITGTFYTKDLPLQPLGYPFNVLCNQWTRTSEFQRK